jgi:cellulose biosynthesis protein BcsQ
LVCKRNSWGEKSIILGIRARNSFSLTYFTDSQANASRVLLGAKLFELPRSVYDVLLEPDRHIREIIVPTPIAGLDLTPSQTSLANAELNLASVRGRECVLRRSMAWGLEDCHYMALI